MPDLPARLDLDQLRRQETEVERREILNSRDLPRLARLLSESPKLATVAMEHWCDHRRGVAPLNYIAMIRFDSARLGLPRELPGTGDVARALIENGAPVNGQPGDSETPLMTAASYGDAEVARALIEAGADVEACAAPTAGGVPNGTALIHAAVFGHTEVLDALVEAGARVNSVEEAAAAGDLADWLTRETDPQALLRALIFAADHQRLGVIDQLIAAGVPVDAVDDEWGRQALRVAAQHGRPASVRRLLGHGANPDLRDDAGLTPLDLSAPAHRYLDHEGHDEVRALLEPITASHR